MSRDLLLIFCVLIIWKHLPKVDFERSGRGQEPSRGHKFSILENFLSIRDFTSAMRLHFRSDLVGVALVGATPLHLLSQTALPLKSPTGAFIDSLRSSNANCFNFICNFMAAAFFQLSRIINTSFSIVDVEQNASFFAAVSDGTAQFKKVGCFIKLFCESTIQSCHGNGLAPKGSKTGAVRTLKIEYAASGTSRQ